MHDEALRQLLLDADASIRVGNRRDLVDSVRRRHARRRQLRHSGLACTFVALAVASAVVVRPHPTNLKVNRDAIAALSIEADLHELTATTLLAAESAARVESPRQEIDDVQIQRDRAALILVYQADRRAGENHPDLAIAAYRRTIELFPKTHWADVARQRLRELQT